MNVRHLMVAALCFLPFAGCMGSLQSPASRREVIRQAEINERAAQRKGDVVPVDEHGDGPLKQLAVKGIVIKADEVWDRNLDELADQRKQLGPEAFDAYVQKESVQLINDRLGEALLYHDALLRIPKGADERLSKMVDDRIRELVTTEYDGVQRRYEQALAAKGRTLEQERQQRLRQLTISAYLNQDFKAKIEEPTRSELMDIFEKRKDEWRRPPQRKMSLIDLRILKYLPKGVTEPTRDQYEQAKSEARAEAQRIIEDARLGTPFDELAKKHSDGLHADDGGEWGWIKRGMVRDRFVPAVDELYRLDEGAVGGPVETNDSIFIVRCDEIDPGYDPDFETAQPRLKEAYQQEKYAKLVGEHIAELREKSGITIHTLERFHAAVVAAAEAYRPKMGPS